MHRVETMSMLVIAMAFSGCVQDEPVPDAPLADVDVVIPDGAFDQATGGPWYTWSGAVQAPATLRIVNEDRTMHRVLVLPSPAQEAPHWALGDDHHAGGHDDGDASAAHDHGAMAAGDMVADVELQAGEETLLVIEEAGLFVLHCHPHPWMEAILDIDGAPSDFRIAPQSMVENRIADGTTAQGASSEVPVEVRAPNLMHVLATVTWDDAADDLEVGGATLNQPDTLQASLVAPNGSIVASQRMEGRQGVIQLEFSHDLAWPDVLQAPSYAHAVEAVAAAMPDDTSLTGTWRVVVEVLTAPGVLEDDGMDGQQAWEVAVTLGHAWPKVMP